MQLVALRIFRTSAPKILSFIYLKKGRVGIEMFTIRHFVDEFHEITFYIKNKKK